MKYALAVANGSEDMWTRGRWLESASLLRDGQKRELGTYHSLGTLVSKNTNEGRQDAMTDKAGRRQTFLCNPQGNEFKCGVRGRRTWVKFRLAPVSSRLQEPQGMFRFQMVIRATYETNSLWHLCFDNLFNHKQAGRFGFAIIQCIDTARLVVDRGYIRLTMFYISPNCLQ